jgi:hypothetical protein
VVKNEKKAEKIRASVSLPSDQYVMLEQLAAEKKVSIAWVVRDAVDLYLKERWPLLPSRLE